MLGDCLQHPSANDLEDYIVDKNGMNIRNGESDVKEIRTANKGELFYSFQMSNWKLV